MGKLIGISTGLKNVDMAPGNIPCVVINSDFGRTPKIFKEMDSKSGPQNLC